MTWEGAAGRRGYRSLVPFRSELFRTGPTLPDLPVNSVMTYERTSSRRSKNMPDDSNIPSRLLRERTQTLVFSFIERDIRMPKNERIKTLQSVSGPRPDTGTVVAPSLSSCDISSSLPSAGFLKGFPRGCLRRHSFLVVNGGRWALAAWLTFPVLRMTIMLVMRRGVAITE